MTNDTCNTILEMLYIYLKDNGAKVGGYYECKTFPILNSKTVLQAGVFVIPSNNTKIAAD
jgi:hypothetical protein